MHPDHDPATTTTAAAGTDPLALVLGLAGLGSVVVVALALVALARRRSWSYFLVTAALGTLLVRTSLGALSVGGVMALGDHHLHEHALDVVMIALLLGAVYLARPPGPRSADAPDEPSPTDDQPTSGRERRS